MGQASALREWNSIERGVTSVITEVECLRTIDRLRLERLFDEAELAERRAALSTLLRSAEIVELSSPILHRASQPLPVTVSTLDALHLATALQWRDFFSIDLVMATHDARLGLASRAMGLEVVGVNTSY